MFGLDYSTPAYAPGKLVDDAGQGSTNDNYGTTLAVAPEPPPPPDPGNVYGNATPLLRPSDVGFFALGAALFAVAGKGAVKAVRKRRGRKRTRRTKKQTDFARPLGALVMAGAVFMVIGRHVSDNFDSAMSMLPGNVF